MVTRSVDGPPPLGRLLGRVLGTAIYQLSLEDEATVFLMADLHLQPGDEEKLAAFEGMLAGVSKGGLVVVLGDLFEYWVGRKQIGVEPWRVIVDTIGAAAERGVQMYLLHGNRDFQLDRSFESATGARVVPGGLRLEPTNGRPLLCLHGDELCLNDLAHQRTKRVLRSPPVRLLFNYLPFPLSRRFAETVRAKSRDRVAGADPESLWPSRRALAATRELGAQDLCFGHVHVAGSDMLPGDGQDLRYYVLPSFEPPERGHARLRSTEGLKLYASDEVQPWLKGPSLGP